MRKTENRISPFQVFLKPIGSACNLKCSYCYYTCTLSQSRDDGFTLMTDNILEKYIVDHFESSPGPDYFFSWHGGEPTLAGIDFYRRAVFFQKRHKPANGNIINGIQTNGTLISDEWCRFFLEENFYVGISIDGPEALHNRARVFRNGAPSFSEVMKGYEKLIRYGIRNEILCVVSGINAVCPKEVYTFIKNLGASFLTFLPLVVLKEGGTEADLEKSVIPDEFGSFLCEIFDEWAENDIGKVNIQIFEEAVSSVINNDHTLCIFKKKCGRVPVLEVNGDFYSCDHYVRREYLVGNIAKSSLAELLDSEKQKSFGEAKYTTLPEYCRQCEVLDMCNGECPKNRVILSPGGEPGLNYLCRGYKKFFTHIRPFTDAVASEWQGRRI